MRVFCQLLFLVIAALVERVGIGAVFVSDSGSGARAAHLCQPEHELDRGSWRTARDRAERA